MPLIGQGLVVLTGGVLLWTYLLYPLLLARLARRGTAAASDAADLPFVTVFVAARNEVVEHGTWWCIIQGQFAHGGQKEGKLPSSQVPRNSQSLIHD